MLEHHFLHRRLRLLYNLLAQVVERVGVHLLGICSLLLATSLRRPLVDIGLDRLLFRIRNYRWLHGALILERLQALFDVCHLKLGLLDAHHIGRADWLLICRG